MSYDDYTCRREGCNQSPDFWGFGFCSSECQQLQLQLEVERMDAWGEMTPREAVEEITIEDITNRRQRAKRWTPETMKERIEELKP